MGLGHHDHVRWSWHPYFTSCQGLNNMVSQVATADSKESDGEVVLSTRCTDSRFLGTSYITCINHQRSFGAPQAGDLAPTDASTTERGVHGRALAGCEEVPSRGKEHVLLVGRSWDAIATTDKHGPTRYTDTTQAQVCWLFSHAGW